jgi:nitrite reductase (NO-forming)
MEKHMINTLIKHKSFVALFLVGIVLLAAYSPAASEQSGVETGQADIHYTLKTASEGNQLLFIGVGGEIDGQVNPDLQAQEGDNVSITLINDDGRIHDIVIDEFDAATSKFGQMGQEETIQFTVDQAGTFFYYCGVSGHRQAGMEGQLIVSP